MAGRTGEVSCGQRREVRRDPRRRNHHLGDRGLGGSGQPQGFADAPACTGGHGEGQTADRQVRSARDHRTCMRSRPHSGEAPLTCRTSCCSRRRPRTWFFAVVCLTEKQTRASHWVDLIEVAARVGSKLAGLTLSDRRLGAAISIPSSKSNSCRVPRGSDPEDLSQGLTLMCVMCRLAFRFG